MRLARISYVVAVVFVASATLAPSSAKAEENELTCAFHATRTRFAPKGDSEKRQYAPDRRVDVLHLRIDVTPDFKNRTVAGTTTIRFVPIAEPLVELTLHALDLTILAVESKTPIADHQLTDEHLVITFADPVPVGRETTVTITHEAEPRRGLYFRTPEMGYRPEDTHLWTQGETHEARHWFPSFDYPNERFTSEVIARVPPDMIVLSNGRKVSERIVPNTKRKVVRWLQDKPHVNYLIALVVGKFKKVEDKYRDIPLAFYTPSSQIEYAKNSFEGTADMMKFFENEVGVAYPWDRYDQVVVDDFMHGGMENTTLTVLTDRTLFPDETEKIRTSQGLVSHELAHQWFGDYVTCKDWSHIWLNEGFATYYAHLYDGHKNGRDHFLYDLHRDAKAIFKATDSPRPIVNRKYDRPFEQFGYRTYQKGSWVLHMLRTQLGPDLYRRCIRTYIERHALGSVVTQDLNAVFEELTGRSFDRFFDQWVYHARYPELEVSYDWLADKKLAKITVKQTQKTGDDVLLFSFPSRVRFVTASGTTERDISIEKKKHDFYFALKEKPVVVRFDPAYGLLAKITFKKPKKMLYAQLARADDVIGRMLAAEALADKDDKKTVEKLKAALNKDSFFGLRIEASKALRSIRTNEALAALLGSLDQPDARVRRQVVSDLADFYDDTAQAALQTLLTEEKNPAILSVAIEGLGKYHAPQVADALRSYLESDSYKNRLAEAAIRSLRIMDHPDWINPLRKVLAEREQNFTTRGFGRGLSTLAYLGRNLDDKDEVREFISPFVNDKKRWLRIEAIRALGTLRDTKAISLVESFTGDRDDDPVQKAAKAALKKLRDAKKIPVELSDLREEVEQLKKTMKSLESKLEDVTKENQAREKADGDEADPNE